MRYMQCTQVHSPLLRAAWYTPALRGLCLLACHQTHPHLRKVAPGQEEDTPKVTRRKAYLNKTSVSNPENLRNCEGLLQGAGAKGHQVFYCN